MFENVAILSIITFFPLIVALTLMVISWSAKSQEAKDQIAANSPYVALIVSSVIFILSLMLVFAFDPTTADFQFVESKAWLGGGIEYRLGVDGISILFVLLTTFLTPLCILASRTSIKERMLEYMVAFWF
jgi:NADH-quinone oxidoreductase subunit M